MHGPFRGATQLDSMDTYMPNTNTHTHTLYMPLTQHTTHTYTTQKYTYKNKFISMCTRELVGTLKISARVGYSA